MRTAIPRACAAASVLGMLILATAAKAQEVFHVSCLPERLAVAAGDSVQLDVWVATATGAVTQNVTTRWTATAGRITDEQAATRWLLHDVAVDTRQSATVEVSVSGIPAGSCSLNVWVSERARLELRLRGEYISRGIFLKPDQSAESGYGLYSYFLMREPSNASAAARAASFTAAFLDVVPVVADQEVYVRRRELNAAFLPVKGAPPEGLTAPARKSWVLEHYDYEHAKRLLSLYPQLAGEGPFIVAVPMPLRSPVKPMFQWDLSGFDSTATAQSVNRFLNQAAQLYDWQNPESLPKLRDRLVTIVTSMFVGRAAAERWMQMTR